MLMKLKVENGEWSEPSYVGGSNKQAIYRNKGWVPVEDENPENEQEAQNKQHLNAKIKEQLAQNNKEKR